ncbi:hypothetical protein MMC16_002280 [Acarospora aff. strigata]|nr:hypothetical protein [Acarospora aff. strigata]
MGLQKTQDTNRHIHSSAERIEQLNGIDKDIAKLLHSAGLAVKALTKSLEGTQEDDSLPGSLENHKTAFTSAASQYFSLLSSIDVRLRRQIYALEEADIISAEGSVKESQTALAVPTSHGATGGAGIAVPSSDKANAAASGLGSLDIGWLNSRNDTVGKEMEAELWAKANDFIKTLERAGVTASAAEEDASSAHSGDGSNISTI